MWRFISLSFSLTEDAKQIPIIPGLSSGGGTMIYAGSIGTQIANELIDTYRCILHVQNGSTRPKTYVYVYLYVCIYTYTDIQMIYNI